MASRSLPTASDRALAGRCDPPGAAFVDELPTVPGGAKIQRKELREQPLTRA